MSEVGRTYGIVDAVTTIASWDASEYQDIGEALLIHVVSDVIFALILIGLAWFLGRVRRRNLRHFFGVGPPGTGLVDIQLSNIWVEDSGTKSVLETARGFAGYAITETEYHYALQLAQKIQSKLTSRVLRALGDQFSENVGDPPVVCKIGSSPGYLDSDNVGVDLAFADDLVRNELRLPGTVLYVGSPIYNVATNYVFTHAAENAHVRFVRVEQQDALPGADRYVRGIEIRKYNLDGSEETFLRETEVDESGRSGRYTEYFAIQKIEKWAGESASKTVFVAAGTSTAATGAALMQLAQWRGLRSRFANKSFAMVFKLVTPVRELPADGHARLPLGWQDPIEIWATK